eukprot:TRINITY_DN3340_c0_g1_i2.p1 TRINITY_DN3340_c0_g1~~TRINITY_DN3340_c0_g1_i2.p1  ORF type:complete len:497 (+),score=79.44 TRINITY_DN3340_c0_g1_i2:45-1535(+)
MSEEDLPEGIDELKELLIGKCKELESLKKSLANLAITVVQQDRHIKTLSSYITGAGESKGSFKQESNPSAEYTNTGSYTDTINEEQLEAEEDRDEDEDEQDYEEFEEQEQQEEQYQEEDPQDEQNYAEAEDAEDPEDGQNNKQQEEEEVEDELENEQDRVANMLRQQMEQASEFLHQLHTDSYIAEPFPARSYSPYLQHQQSLFQQNRVNNHSHIRRSSTPNQNSSYGRSRGERQVPTLPRPAYSSNSTISGHRDWQKESVHSTTSRGHKVGESGVYGRSQTPTRLNGQYKSDISSGIINRRPRSVLNLREVGEVDDYEQQLSSRYARNLPRRSSTPTNYSSSSYRYDVDLPTRSYTPRDQRPSYRYSGDLHRRSSTPTEYRYPNSNFHRRSSTPVEYRYSYRSTNDQHIRSSTPTEYRSKFARQQFGQLVRNEDDSFKKWAAYQKVNEGGGNEDSDEEADQDLVQRMDSLRESAGSAMSTRTAERKLKKNGKLQV